MTKWTCLWDYSVDCWLRMFTWGGFTFTWKDKRHQNWRSCKSVGKFPQTWDKVGHGSLGTAPCLQDKISQIFALHLNHRLLHFVWNIIEQNERNRFLLKFPPAIWLSFMLSRFVPWFQHQPKHRRISQAPAQNAVGWCRVATTSFCSWAVEAATASLWLVG